MHTHTWIIQGVVTFISLYLQILGNLGVYIWPSGKYLKIFEFILEPLSKYLETFEFIHGPSG